MANAPSTDGRAHPPSPSPSNEIARNEEIITSAKPAQRFVIGVLLALFIILGLCFIFLLKPYVERGLRRLRHQEQAVEVCIQKRRRRRRPRLHEIWIDLHQIAGEMDRQTPKDDLDWRISHKPLTVSLDRHSPSTCSEQAVNPTGDRLDQQACMTGLSKERRSTLRGLELFEPIPDSVPTPEETNHPCEPPELVDSTAQVCFLIAFPSPATSRQFPLPNRSPCRTRTSTPIPNGHSENQNGVNGPLTPFPASRPSDTQQLLRSQLPSDMCLGISSSSITLYQ